MSNRKRCRFRKISFFSLLFPSRSHPLFFPFPSRRDGELTILFSQRKSFLLLFSSALSFTRACPFPLPRLFQKGRQPTYSPSPLQVISFTFLSTLFPSPLPPLGDKKSECRFTHSALRSARLSYRYITVSLQSVNSSFSLSFRLRSCRIPHTTEQHSALKKLCKGSGAFLQVRG